MLFPALISPFFFFNDTATTEIYTLSLHDALPICIAHEAEVLEAVIRRAAAPAHLVGHSFGGLRCAGARSEEHTSELQSLRHLVCRLLLEKKKKNTAPRSAHCPATVRHTSASATSH